MNTYLNMRATIRAWIAEGFASGQSLAFWIGARDALDHEFEERFCGGAGTADESDYCEGGREVLQRIAMPYQARRIQHGEIVHE